jgi:hypothetical protein
MVPAAGRRAWEMRIVFPMVIMLVSGLVGGAGSATLLWSRMMDDSLTKRPEILKIAKDWQSIAKRWEAASNSFETTANECLQIVRR